MEYYEVIYISLCHVNWSQINFYVVSAALILSPADFPAIPTSFHEEKFLFLFVFNYGREVISVDYMPILFFQNRVHVSPRLSSNLRTELQNLFCKTVIDPVIDRLVGKKLKVVYCLMLNGKFTEISMNYLIVCILSPYCWGMKTGLKYDLLPNGTNISYCFLLQL